MTAESVEKSPSPSWTKHVLAVAGVYNLVWSLFAVLFPAAPFDLTGMERLNHPQIWQCLGMVIGVYGVGYLLAAADPFRHWPIVVVGLLGKTLGPIGFVISAVRGDLPWSWGLMIITNDLLWWFPFAVILYLAFKSHTDVAKGPSNFASAVASIESQRGSTIQEISSDRPLLLLFLRHTGCTFCREALADLAAARAEIEALGVRVAVVHMSAPMRATQVFMSYGLEDLHRFSDPTCELYRAFGLPRGSLAELLGPKVWARGLAAMFHGNGLGGLEGDGFQMPGMFLLRDGRIVQSYRHRTSADRPDYVAFAETGRTLPSKPHGVELPTDG